MQKSPRIFLKLSGQTPSFGWSPEKSSRSALRLCDCRYTFEQLIYRHFDVELLAIKLLAVDIVKYRVHHLIICSPELVKFFVMFVVCLRLTESVTRTMRENILSIAASHACIAVSELSFYANW